MIDKVRNSKAFTLIELVVTVGIIGILVLIASSNLSGQKEEAQHNAALADMKIVADATEMYNIDNEDWPRLTDVPYTSKQLERYSENVYDATGKKVTLPAKANYYDIDYEKLSQDAKAPVKKENYILQNPVGEVYYMENLTAEGKARVDYSSNKQANQSLPSQLAVSDLKDTTVVITSDPDTEVKVGDSEWQPSGHKFTGLSPETKYIAYARFAATESHLASQAISENFTTENSGLYDFTKHTFTNAGQTGRTGPSQSMLDNAYRGSEVEGYVTSDNGIQLWTVPKSGTYRIEVYGAQSGSKDNASRGGKGAIMKGDFIINKGESIKILVGQKGLDDFHYEDTGGGGGGSFVVKESDALIIAGGGGSRGRPSANRNSNTEDASVSINGRNGYGYSGGGTNGSGGLATSGSHVGGAGGGFNSNGQRGSHSNAGEGGKSFKSGGIGGRYGLYLRSGGSEYKYLGHGGFGGGGGAGHGGGGAGGGYSGGGGGNQDYTSGGGGGSYNSGANQANSVGNTGHGKVIITYIGE